ncbi:MAG: histidine triad nucleotide-binding protein [Pseudomonas fluorescens]|nr:MAG: histidine triad nucleotide-binding protein [Pseudomonas fluorescens]
MKRYTEQDNPTIFGKILRGEIPCTKVYEDDLVLAFHDIAPKAPVHVIIIPKQHLEGNQSAVEGDEALLGHLMVTANTIATQLGVNESGYRLITNAGKGAGQEVPHLHLHLLAGTYPLPGF